MACQLTKETEMTSRNGASYMCNKREEEARLRLQVKRKKSVGLVDEKSATWPQHDFATRTERRRYCQVQELPQNGHRYIYRDSGDDHSQKIKKLTTNCKEPIPARLRLAATYKNRCLIL